jgi:endo-1,4-beta-xylanase
MKRLISALTAFSVCLISIIIFSFRSQRENSLKDLFEGSFYIGAALNLADVSGTEVRALPTLKQNFNSISPENGLKWVNVHPEPDTYDFSYVDKYVALGESLDAFVVGHTLVWHEQIPRWVFENSDGSSKTKAELLTTLESHIEKVMGRYRGKIHGWDVVNEAIEDNGEFRNTKWYAIAGVDYIKTAFRKANQTDPSAVLYYNDYSVFLSKK